MVSLIITIIWRTTLLHFLTTHTSIYGALRLECRPIIHLSLSLFLFLSLSRGHHGSCQQLWVFALSGIRTQQFHQLSQNSEWRNAVITLTFPPPSAIPVLLEVFRKVYETQRYVSPPRVFCRAARGRNEILKVSQRKGWADLLAPLSHFSRPLDSPASVTFSQKCFHHVFTHEVEVF